MSNLQIRGGTTTEWSNANPTLLAREPGVDTTLNKLKIGDGSTAWNSLPYLTMDGLTNIEERTSDYSNVVDNSGKIWTRTDLTTPTVKAIVKSTGVAYTYDAYTKMMLHFEDNALIDSVGTYNLTAIGNAQISTSDKKFGSSSILFDGVGDYIDIGYNSDIDFIMTQGNSFTIDFWVKGNWGNSSNPIFFSIHNTARTVVGIHLFMHTQYNMSYCQYSTDINGTFQNIAVNSNPILNNGAWRHYVVSSNNSTTAVAVDGVWGNGSSTARVKPTGCNQITIGGAAVNADGLIGSIDEFRISNYVRWPIGTNFTPPISAYVADNPLPSGTIYSTKTFSLT